VSRKTTGLTGNVIAIFAILAFMVMALLTACGSSSGESSSVPKSLIGTWYQHGTDGEDLARAEVTAGGIQIWVVGRDSSYIYWLGTFDGTKSTATPFTYYSHGDQDALATYMLASEEKDKPFKYKDGVLSYKYSILGVSTTVRLTKNEPSGVVPTVTVTDHHGVYIPSTRKTVKPYQTPRKGARQPAKVLPPKAPAPAYKAPSVKTKR